jgi:hypothetical protein
MRINGENDEQKKERSTWNAETSAQNQLQLVIESFDRKDTFSAHCHRAFIAPGAKLNLNGAMI